MGLMNLVKDSLGTAGRLWKWKQAREFDEVKSKILRHAERAQAKGSGAAWYTAESLLRHGVIERSQLDAAHKALEAFMLEGYFDYQEGKYYLKAHAPKPP